MSLKASQYKFDSAFTDKANVCHLLFRSEIKGDFFPLFLNQEVCQDFLGFNSSKKIKDKVTSHIGFISRVFAVGGLEVKYLILDADENMIFRPVITSECKLSEKKSIFFTTTIPIHDAMSFAVFGIPIYVTSRIKTGLDVFPVGSLTRYVDQNKV